VKKAWFLTGTDTGVGKTAVAASLARAFHEAGLRVGVMKPVETGCELRDGRLVGADALLLKEAASSETPLEQINPYSFAPPISPELAARQDGVEIDFEVIRAAYEEICSSSDVVIVEGAGGLLVPLGEVDGGIRGDCEGARGGETRGSGQKGSDVCFMTDLAAFLGLPIIIVAPSRIGVINQTMLTVHTARSRGLIISGIVLNHPVAPDPNDRSLESNFAEVARNTGVEVLGELSFNKKNAPYMDVRGVLTALTAGDDLFS